MVTALLDTSILVDFLRGFPVAVTWLSSQTSVGVTRIVELEVIEGVRDHCGLAAAVKLHNSAALENVSKCGSCVFLDSPLGVERC